MEKDRSYHGGVPAILAQDERLEVLVVDDNSPDGTGKLADELAEANPGRVHVLHRSRKEGLGLAYRRLRGREGIGLGDAKLLAGIGAWVAWPGLATVVLIAALSGLGLALLQRSRGKPIHMVDKLPFAPHLCIGAWLVWLYGPLTPAG